MTSSSADADGLRFRRLQPHEDLARLCQLFETVFQQPMTPACWRWKYGQSPGAESFNLVVEQAATGRLVGHMGVVILPGRRAGAALRMGQVCDVMIHPEFRAGIGPGSLYQRMNDALRQMAHAPGGAAPLFMYGFPGLRPANLGERIGVYRRMRICTEYIAGGSLRAPSGWPAVWARCNPWRLRAQAQTEGACSDEALNAIWQRYCQLLCAQPALDAAPRIVKNAAYLRWRYLSHPQQHSPQPGAGGAAPLYTLWLLLRPGRQPQGWLVTRAQPRPVVVDSCLPPGPAWAAAALKALPPPAAAQPWASWLPHMGAVAVPTPIHAVEVLGQPFHTQWPDPEFQPGDTDVF